MTLDSEQNKLDNTLEWDSENTLHDLDNSLGWDSEDTLDDIEIDWLLNEVLTKSLVINDDLDTAFFEGLDAVVAVLCPEIHKVASSRFRHRLG